MFDFPDTLFVGPLFLHLVLPKAFVYCCLSVGGSIGVEHPDIKEGPFISSTPSSLAPSVVIAVRPDSTSLDTSCRSSSTWTSWHTSVSRFVVMSLISLCRMEGNPPRWQESTCSTVKLAPHSQLEGVREGIHPYLKARASTKAPSWRTKPCSSKGREISQLEEPLSRARSMAFWRVGVSPPLKLLASVVASSRRFCRISALEVI